MNELAQYEVYLDPEEARQAIAVLSAMLSRDVSLTRSKSSKPAADPKPVYNNYREVKDVITEHFANSNLQFTITHRMYICMYTYTITHHGETYVLRRGTEIIAEAGLIDRLNSSPTMAILPPTRRYPCNSRPSSAIS